MIAFQCICAMSLALAFALPFALVIFGTLAFGGGTSRAAAMLSLTKPGGTCIGTIRGDCSPDGVKDDGADEVPIDEDDKVRADESYKPSVRLCSLNSQQQIEKVAATSKQ